MMTRQLSDVTENFCPTTWTTSALPPVKLSTDQREKFRVLATQLLSNTLRDYDIYDADPRQRSMSQRRWKPVKKKDHITVYEERYPISRSEANIMDRVSMAFHASQWTEPKLLVATGWIEGTLDDVVYGITSADAQNMLLKDTVLQNKLINGAVLACIDAPCNTDPFRFLGIKWLVKGPSTAFKGIVRARDLVVLEATGVTTRPNGERIGYHLLHSVNLSQYRDTTPWLGAKVTRGHISRCSIFREVPAGLGSRHSKVDVFVKGYVETCGKILNSVALKAESTEFISSWDTVECANLKKLMWCFRQLMDGGRARHRDRTSTQHPQVSSSVSCSSHAGSSSDYQLSLWPQSHSLELSSSCGTCTRRLFKLVSGAFFCMLCSRITCFRCRVPRIMKEVNSKLWLRQKEVLICKRCVLQVDHLAAVDVARAEVQAGWVSTTLDKRPKKLAITGMTTHAGAAIVRLPAEEESPLSVLSRTADQQVNSFRGVQLIEIPQPRTSEPDEVGLSDVEYRKLIWSRIVEQRMVAESIYKLAPETAEAMNALIKPITRR
ncbi:unnamed protein product [Peronospora belbahrii]|uniref:FYVE-type domain-containing protein n=1 Tax=Peronospora belbahrii TaxID=622444 RepID=A0AAU9KR14_9STRA|nr:unnamed protein product [Peronospora belbahrii]